MQHWEWWLFLIVPGLLFIVFGSLFLLIKRHRGHGYFLSKFSAFSRVRFEHLEQRRQTYCPANEKCDCQPKNSAAHIEPNVSCPHRAATLYMSFAGAAMIVGGVRTTEWRGSMRELHHGSNDNFDALFFTDPAQCFYLQDPEYRWEGIAHYRRLVEVYSTLYQRVILIGASLGGSMVCMCADLATLSIAFNPILDPILLGLPWRLMGAFCPARQARVVREQVQRTMERITANETGHPCVLHIHWSELSPADLRQVHRVVGGGKFQKRRQSKSLTTAMSFDPDSPSLNSTAGVHVWLHQCSRHALAMHLKRTGQLIPLLKEHVTPTSLGLLSISSQLELKKEEQQTPSIRHSTTSAELSSQQDIRIDLL